MPPQNPQPQAAPNHKQFFILGSLFTVLMLLVAPGILYFQNNSAPVAQQSVKNSFFFNGKEMYIAHTLDRNLEEGTITPLDYADTLRKGADGNWYQNGVLTEAIDQVTFVPLPEPGNDWVSF